MFDALDQRLFHLQLQCRKKVDHLLAGLYRSVFKGQGLEFDEVRPYENGDDVRNIDWNVTARTGQPYIKKYHEEREGCLFFIIDMSASCHYGSGIKNKRDLITEFCAYLSFSAQRNNDKVGLLLFTDQVELFLPPRKGTQGVMHLLDELIHFKSQSKQTNLCEALDYFGNLQFKRSIVFVISDFQDKNYLEALSVLATQHELISVQVSDTREYSLPNAGLVQFKNVESGAIQNVDLSQASTLHNIENINKKRMQLFKSDMQMNGITSLSINEQADLVESILEFFHQSERRLAEETGG